MKINKNKDIYEVRSKEGLLLYEHTQVYGIKEYIKAQKSYISEEEYAEAMKFINGGKG